MFIRMRITSIEKFSSFVEAYQTEGRQQIQWRKDLNLRKNFATEQKKIQQNIIVDEENFWAEYWLQALKTDGKNRLARNHISAYLEEACYWAAKKSLDRYQLLSISKEEAFWHYFQTAQEKTINSEKLLKIVNKFEPGNFNSSLKNYIEYRLKSAIIDAIYKEYRVGKYSDWGLLKRLTQRRLQDALKSVGCFEPEVSRYCLAWKNCFLEIYTPTQRDKSSRRLPQPTVEQFQIMAELYNQMRVSPLVSREIASSPELDATSFEKWMKVCIKAARSYETPKNPLDYSEPIDESNLDSMLSSSNEEPFLHTTWVIELNEAKRQVQSLLLEEFNALESERQKILKLWYGFKLTQKEIASLLNIRQYTVSRYIDQDKRKMLRIVVRVVQRSKDNSNEKIQPNSEQIERLMNPLEEWLTQYCQRLIYSFLEDTLKFLSLDGQKFLVLYYGHLEEQQVAEKLQIPLSEVICQISNTKQFFQEHLSNYVQTKLNASLSPQHKQIVAVVDEWLSRESDAILNGLRTKLPETL
ncbi:MAG: sigma-70 family RNA polymerase sigma factor [Crinalium sp.]